jgi:hypothetical protein
MGSINRLISSLNKKAIRKLAAEDLPTFEEAIEGKKYLKEETGNYVSFGTLSPEEQKKLREEYKKKVEELEEEGKGKGEKKIKENSKRLKDLESRIKAVKKKDDLGELVSELGRIKGQLSNAKFKDKLESEMKAVDKAIENAKENTSFTGKIKSFFGLGKKARLKEARLLLNELQDEIEHLKRDINR